MWWNHSSGWRVQQYYCGSSGDGDKTMCAGRNGDIGDDFLSPCSSLEVNQGQSDGWKMILPSCRNLKINMAIAWFEQNKIHWFQTGWTKTARTYRSNEMCVHFQRFTVTFILYVPNSERLVVCYAQDVFTTRMKNQASNPIIMANLEKQWNKVFLNAIDCLSRKKNSKTWKQRTNCSYTHNISPQMAAWLHIRHHGSDGAGGDWSRGLSPGMWNS